MTGKRRWLFALFMLVCCAVFITLAGWQVKRLHWKENILAAIAAEQAAPADKPLTLDNLDEVARGAVHTRRGALTGTLDSCHVVYLDNRSLDDVTGHNLLVPLRLSTGQTIYLNMGWMAQAPEQPFGVCAYEMVTVQGFLGLPRTNRFMPKQEIAPRHWVAPDPVLIGGHDKLAPVSPAWLVVQTIQPELKVEGLKPIAAEKMLPPNNHKQYAIFWAVMALMTGGLTAYLLITGRKAPPDQA